jgi:SAM-dependent methyltransferase
MRLMRGDAHELPFAAGCFDVVYCRYVLEHVRDPQRVLREMARVLKPGGRALAQENNMRMMVFDPDCPHVDALLPAFCELQRQLGGDALIGKRLFALFKHAGFHGIELSYQPEIHPADSPTFKGWIDNAMAVVSGASELLVRHKLATNTAVESALAELSALREREDASGLFHWNRAVGIK